MRSRVLPRRRYDLADSISTLSVMTRISPDLLPRVKTGQESDIPQTIFDFKTDAQVVALISISTFRYRHRLMCSNKIRTNRVD